MRKAAIESVMRVPGSPSCTISNDVRREPWFSNGNQTTKRQYFLVAAFEPLVEFRRW